MADAAQVSVAVVGETRRLSADLGRARNIVGREAQAMRASMAAHGGIFGDALKQGREFHHLLRNFVIALGVIHLATKSIQIGIHAWRGEIGKVIDDVEDIPIFGDLEKFFRVNVGQKIFGATQSEREKQRVQDFATEGRIRILEAQKIRSVSERQKSEIQHEIELERIQLDFERRKRAIEAEGNPNSGILLQLNEQQRLQERAIADAKRQADMRGQGVMSAPTAFGQYKFDTIEGSAKTSSQWKRDNARANKLAEEQLKQNREANRHLKKISDNTKALSELPS